MRKTSKETAFIKEQKILLGQALKAIRTDDERGYISLRKLEEAVKIPASNLKYIEDGVNAPSPEAYDAIIRHIAPTEEERRELDRLYSSIRKTPPPDVCRIVCDNSDLNNALRLVGDQILTTDQISQITALLASFNSISAEGATING